MWVARDRREFVELNKDEALIDLGWDKTPRQRPKRDPELFKTFCNDMGVLTEEQVKAEAGRCLSCGATEVDENRCIGCGLCTTRCKFDAIHLLRTHPAASKMVSCDKKVLPLAQMANRMLQETYETLERLAAYGYHIYRTDLNGSVEIFLGN